MRFQIYGGRDPREVPAYTVGSAAYLLNISPSTLSKWVVGRRSRASNPQALPVPSIIERPDGTALLSFTNLIEAHVLASIRRRHGISLTRVRRAVDYLRDLYPDSHHPLAERQFQTDGVDLFIEHLNQFVNVSCGGQIALRELIKAYLQRIERDENGMPVRLFPFSRIASEDFDASVLREQPRTIVIDPRLSFGKPVLEGTNIPADAIASRYKAGDTIEDLADDFALDQVKVNEAIRYSLRLNAA